MAEETVTLTNRSGADVDVFGPGGTPGAFGVAADATVTVPGVLLDENDDHYLIGPAGADLTTTDPDPQVRAWPKASWSVGEKTDSRKGGGGKAGDA